MMTRDFRVVASVIDRSSNVVRRRGDGRAALPIDVPPRAADSGRHRAGARHGADPMNRPILGLVGPRVLAYLGKRRVKTAKLHTEGFGSAPDLFQMDGRRDPTMQEGFEALALAPGGLQGVEQPGREGRPRVA